MCVFVDLNYLQQTLNVEAIESVESKFNELLSIDRVLEIFGLSIPKHDLIVRMNMLATAGLLQFRHTRAVHWQAIDTTQERVLTKMIRLLQIWKEHT